LKPEEVFNCFIDDLITIKPINTNVDKFCDYLLKTYIEQDALFPPNIWAEFAATTNSCESFHAKLNASFSAAHPNIFVLIEILLGIQSEIYVSLRSSATQPIKKVKKEKFLRGMLSFTSGELSRLNFVKDVSFKFCCLV
jgi:hypothetical protein